MTLPSVLPGMHGAGQGQTSPWAQVGLLSATQFR